MIIAILSTLVSSIALVGVAISLLLQARQLRANQVQVTYASQLELLKLGLDNPSIITELGMGYGGTEDLVKSIYLNWYITHLAISFDTGIMNKPNLEGSLKGLFAVEDSRRWWADARQSYRNDTSSRRRKAFFAIVDGQFQQASRVPEAAETAKPHGPCGDSSPPSS
jgi:hypothetical protein